MDLTIVNTYNDIFATIITLRKNYSTNEKSLVVVDISARAFSIPVFLIKW